MDSLHQSYSIFWCLGFLGEMCRMHAMLRSSEDLPMASNTAKTAKKSDQKHSIACVQIFRCMISASGVLIASSVSTT
jgi:hypothetical protein